MKKSNPRTTLTVVVIVAAVLVVLGFLKPPMQKLRDAVSSDIAASAGKKYAVAECNFLIIAACRGTNQKTAESDTVIGFCGQIFHVNAETNGSIAKTTGDILLWMPQLLRGSGVTILLTVTTVAAGLIFAVFLALGKISKLKPLSAVCSAYIFFFRGTPLLMQLYFIYYGLPQLSPALTINNKFLAAFIAFGLNSGAYCAEIIRAAILSIDKGQFEASKALGLSYGQTMAQVILPQSVRRLIPSVANEIIMTIKDASLVALIALSDLTHITRSISSSSGSVTVFIPAMALYLIMTAVFSAMFRKLEHKFSVYE